MRALISSGFHGEVLARSLSPSLIRNRICQVPWFFWRSVLFHSISLSLSLFCTKYGFILFSWPRGAWKQLTCELLFLPNALIFFLLLFANWNWRRLMILMMRSGDVTLDETKHSHQTQMFALSVVIKNCWVGMKAIFIVNWERERENVLLYIYNVCPLCLDVWQASQVIWIRHVNCVLWAENGKRLMTMINNHDDGWSRWILILFAQSKSSSSSSYSSLLLPSISLHEVWVHIKINRICGKRLVKKAKKNGMSLHKSDDFKNQ